MTGGAFDELIKQFPSLGGVVKQYAATMDEAATRTAGAISNIQKFLDDLKGGQGSTLSPEDRLTAAQAAYGREFSKAQGGNLDALSGITSYAQNLLDASRDFYGSGAGYQGQFTQITDQLTGLQNQFSGVGGAIAQAVSPTAAVPVSAPASIAAPAVANDNSLVAEVQALRRELAAALAQLGAQITSADGENTSKVTTELGKLRSDQRQAASRPAMAGSRR